MLTYEEGWPAAPGPIVPRASNNSCKDNDHGTPCRSNVSAEHQLKVPEACCMPAEVGSEVDNNPTCGQNIDAPQNIYQVLKQN